MAVNFELPATIEQALREELGNLDEVAKEAALVELYRQEKLSHYDFSLALGIGRLETEAVLKRHHVTEDLPTTEECEAALARLRAITP